MLLLVVSSCSKDEINVDNLHAQPFIKTNGQMGLSLYVMTDAKDPESMQMHVSDPSRSLSWSFNVKHVEYDGADYYGSSDIAIPNGSRLPAGNWNVEMLFKDGSTRELSFEVSYSDEAGAIERFSERKMTEAWFDADSNLTVLP